MELIGIVIVLALAQFIGFSMAVGRARGKYNVPAPATTGDEQFERYFRIQMNTLEQLVVFVPAILIAGHFGNPLWAALAGAVFIVGRQLYYFSYAKDPKRRSTGFGIGFLAIVYLLVASLVGLIGSLM